MQVNKRKDCISLIEAMGLRTAKQVADEVIMLLQPHELSSLRNLAKLNKTEKLTVHIDDLMLAAVNNLIDDVVWDIPFYRDVKKSVYAKLTK